MNGLSARPPPPRYRVYFPTRLRLRSGAAAQPPTHARALPPVCPACAGLFRLLPVGAVPRQRRRHLPHCQAQAGSPWKAVALPQRPRSQRGSADNRRAAL